MRTTLLPITTRAVCKDDLGYVIKTWSIDFHLTFPMINVPNNLYVPNQTKLITQIINRADITMACLDDEPDLIVGYVVSEVFGTTTIIHWAQTKGIFRNQGVLDTLLKAISVRSRLTPIVFTHIFKLFPQMKGKYNLIYDPYALEKYK